MRIAIKKIVTMMFLLIAYFLYSAFLKKFSDSNVILYTLFDPFKLLILAFIFGIIVSTFKTLFLGWFKNIKGYQTSRHNFLLLSFDETISSLEKLKQLVIKGSHHDIKVQLAGMTKLHYKPIFLNALINDMISSLFKEEPLDKFVVLIDNSKNEILASQKLEEDRLKSKKSEPFFDIKRAYEYNYQGSKPYIGYYNLKQESIEAKGRNDWNILSLQMLKFYTILLYSMLISLVASTLLVPVLLFSIKINIFLTITIIFIVLTTILSIVWHIIYLWKNKAGPRILAKVWIFYSLSILASINIIWSIFSLEAVLKIKTEVNVDEQLFEFLFRLLYCVLSTALLFYIFSTMVEIFRDVYFSKTILFEGVIIPAIIFVLITFINILNISVLDNQITFTTNLTILSTYWIGVWVLTPILKF
ncbi:hypothetical protein SSABA_v1c02050 [Spiroplasma sabaudiense Ar-1343]|uniref:Transmembrane protein n=1 Tax=Spiroplasma sabaudiense Ar-1343 TaxID=1276257 RepID=W6A9B3_9MOLU|nr:hypothetical protein [Spiroplasma sabaudiense]AHI53617.1 hypothetical protein SSABA_v1c02050 [Spiroplasma sabaudiense Ar-1343]